MLCCLCTSYIFWIVALPLLGLKIYTRLTCGMFNSNKRMNGKTVIVTGANTGIGKETALDLARRGARVILACRDLTKAKKACDEIIQETGNRNVEVKHLDLGSLDSVRKFAKNIVDTEPRLDVLINNAGAGLLKNKLTADKLQEEMQVNHFGPFLLTCLLLDLLKKSTPSRIIMVSSNMHHFANFDIDNLNFEKWFSDLQVYSCSKLANILMSNELSRKLTDTGVTVNSLHPGVVKTDFNRNFSPVWKVIQEAIWYWFTKDASEGAQTTNYLAVSEEVEGVTGEYFSDCKKTRMSKTAKDEGLAKKLWEKSEALVRLKSEEKYF